MSAPWPPWAVMWSLAIGIFAGCKWLTWQCTSTTGAPLWRHAGYLFAWPGLDAPAFFHTPGSQVPRPSRHEWLGAALKTIVGFTAAGAAVRLTRTPPLLAGWLGMLGIVLVLHFGLFHLLSCAWRSAGVDARPLMQAPLWSTSLGEFWGRRWNTAFRDLTHRFLFRPLAAQWGARPAMAVGFLVSGLVHDLVISVPARGGFGGPTIFFVLQGSAIIAERSSVGRRVGLGRGRRGWLFTMLVLGLPLAWLFHPPFVLAIMVPFLNVLLGLAT
jgi:Membrane bound O-acyl transferase family